MLNFKSKHYKTMIMIPCLGILLASSCLITSSLAKEITFEKVSSKTSEVNGNEAAVDAITQETAAPTSPVEQETVSSPEATLEPNVEQAVTVPTDEVVTEPVSSLGAELESIINNAAGGNTYNGNTDARSEGPYSSSIDDYEAEDLVLAVFVNRERISSGIFAIQKNGQYYLPFATLSDMLGFKYDIDTNENYAEGWSLSEEDSYSIDAKNGVLRYKNEKFDLPADAVISGDAASDDVYILINVLSQIWPTKMDVNLSNLVLKIIPDKKLPYQMASERRAAQMRADFLREQRDAEQTFPFVPYPYQAYSKPTVDLSGTLGFDARTDEALATLNVNGINDLAYASADYSVGLSQRGGEFQKPENIRFRLRRQNIHEGALPFGLEDTQLGDVRINNRELISTNAGGRGFVFSTDKNNKAGEFDLVTIEGVGTPGWETELYLNNELLSYSTIDASGQYRFEDVSVGYGYNRFRVVLYGPQGQIRERFENYVYQAGMIKKGENVFSGGVVDANNDLIPIEKRFTGRAEGLTANIYAARGLSEKITGFFTANTVRDRIGVDEVSKQYVSVGGISSIGSTLAQAEVYKELGGGQAVDVRTISDFMGFKVNTQISKYYNFESPDADEGLNAKSLETEIGVKRIFRTLVGALGLELRYNYLKRESGPDNSRIIARQSFGTKAIRMTNVTTTTLTDGSHDVTSGRFGTASRFSRFNLRNFINYALFPDTELQSFQSELRFGRQRDTTAAVLASYDFLGKEKSLSLQLSRDFKKFLGSAETGWSSKSGLGIMLRASTALGPYGDNDAYTLRSSPLSNIGPVNSFLFNDKNYNGVFDEDDMPAQNARVIVNRRFTRDKTGGEGNVTEFVSASVGNTNVQVAKESLDDPYLVPSVEGYTIRPRGGVVHKLQFPLIETGAIDGTLTMDSSGKPFSGVELQLLNEQADVIQSTQTAADGYFTFERIPPGTYTIRANPEDGLDIPFRYVTLAPGDLFKFGTDINAADRPDVENIDLDVKMADDGTVNVKDLISLAKGYKERKINKMVQKTAMSSNEPVQAKIQNASINTTAKAVVKEVRIGEEPEKVRIVLDLSAPTEYSIIADPQTGSIYIEMPYAGWSAAESWKSKSNQILNNYRVEATEQGIRIAIGVADGVEIGTSGLLKAEGSKGDRLFIDIVKK